MDRGAPHLAGRIEGFSPFDLLPFLADLGKEGRLVFRRDDGPAGWCDVGRRGIGAAGCGHLSAREALLAFVWWHRGEFEFRPRPTASQAAPISPAEILMEAVRLADEIDCRSGMIPPSSRPLHLAGGAVRADDPLGCGIPVVVDLLRRTPGLPIDELASRVPLSPLKVRLSIALLVEQGALQVQAERSAAPPPARRPAAWWTELARRSAGGVRVLVATGSGTGPEEVKGAVEAVARELRLAGPLLSWSADGPSSARLRPETGGILSLTFLPASRFNGGLHESFARTCQAVLLVDGAAGDEGTPWAAGLPESVPLLGVPSGIPLAGAVLGGLRRAAGHERRQRVRAARPAG